ncbi:hypothetical protein D3C87_1605680 [compost metagenome]
MLGRGQVKAYTGGLVYILFKDSCITLQFFGIVLQELLIDPYAFHFHIRQYFHQRIIGFIKYFFYCFFDDQRSQGFF